MWTETTRFLVLSLVFHLLYTVSIFDIYFTSPVVHPSRRFSAKTVLEKEDSSTTAPAKRLVLIVGDGLRADTLFKYHDSGVLPAWAEKDVLQHGRVRLDTALSPNKQWKRSGEASPSLPTTTTFDAAPYLRKVVLERGSWGISHTRVPTESRPGHVALIAGMYEDVSAVTKGMSKHRPLLCFTLDADYKNPGWKLNPIPFDSILNQSSHAWSFGSPDILPMFARGATPGTVDMESYAEEAEDFTADATTLDLWVLDRLKSLLKQAESNATLDGELRKPETVFFLHLLGLDTTGHTYRPKSPEYTGNLMVVDAIVEEVERLFSDFFGEEEKEQTAFVFTADHGMSNKGNHGDGELDNTRTPLVVWGAGVRGPKEKGTAQQWRRAEEQRDNYYSNWGHLDQLWREDVSQADITPLMAALIGINMPANSEGVLPLHYLDMSPSAMVRASMANAVEILEMYRVKYEQRSKRMIHFRPFPGLPAEGKDAPGTAAIRAIERHISDGTHDMALESCKLLIDLALQGAAYLQTYDWLLLVGIVLTGYVGSMLYGAIFLFRHYVLIPSQIALVGSTNRSWAAIRHLPVSILSIFFAKFAAERSPPTFYLYAAFAAFFWHKILEESNTLVAAWQAGVASQYSLDRPARRFTQSIALRILLSLLALELMVYGYVQRLAWTAGFIVLGLVWPALSISPDTKTRHDLLIILWTFACTACGLFTLSGVEKEESRPYIIASGTLFLIAGAALAFFPSFFLQSDDAQEEHSKIQKRSESLKRTLFMLRILLVVLVISTIVSVHSSRSLQLKLGLPVLNQAVAWLVLIFCLTVPFIYGLRRHGRKAKESDCSNSQMASHRLILIVFAFAPVFVLLSIRDETIFFGCYCMLLLLWGKLEGALYEERSHATALLRKDSQTSPTVQQSGRTLEREDVRIAICFLFFLHVGFFGTGNIASISSFYLSPVYRLVPIFSPFLMAALLLLKILTPFVILASTFQLICLTPPHPRAHSTSTRKTGLQIAGPPLFGKDSVGGLGLKDAYSIVLLACICTDVLAISFLVMVRTTGSWLEIGQSITHFAMANLLQVFMLALSAVADVIVGGRKRSRHD